MHYFVSHGIKPKREKLERKKVFFVWNSLLNHRQSTSCGCSTVGRGEEGMTKEPFTANQSSYLIIKRAKRSKFMHFSIFLMLGTAAVWYMQRKSKASLVAFRQKRNTNVVEYISLAFFSESDSLAILCKFMKPATVGAAWSARSVTFDCSWRIWARLTRIRNKSREKNRTPRHIQVNLNAVINCIMHFSAPEQSSGVARAAKYEKKIRSAIIAAAPRHHRHEMESENL